MARQAFVIALVRDVFYDDPGDSRLHARLDEAKRAGATLAVLPELPLNRWAPSTRDARDDDAEEPGGERHRRLAAAARSIGIGVIGGAIVRHPSGVRHNTALIFDAHGKHLASYAKLHVPQEPGFWEKDHYFPGTEPPRPIAGFPMPIGVQICSDVNRPEGSHLLAALGCEVILAPRATEAATYARWNVVFRANAITCAVYYLSVNRPGPEAGVGIGGPSFAVSPENEVLLETEDPIGIVEVDHGVVERARHHYPGYLDIRTDLYVDAWRAANEAHRARQVAHGFWER